MLSDPALGLSEAQLTRVQLTRVCRQSHKTHLKQIQKEPKDIRNLGCNMNRPVVHDEEVPRHKDTSREELNHIEQEIESGVALEAWVANVDALWKCQISCECYRVADVVCALVAEHCQRPAAFGWPFGDRAFYNKEASFAQ
jgi:hypothetical protein